MLLARTGHHGSAVTAAHITLLILLVAVLLGAVAVCAAPAQARGSVKALITDASDGVVDGSYSIATVKSALAVVRSDPTYQQYSDIEGVLVDYLASLTKTKTPSAQPTQTADPSTSTPTPKASKSATSRPKKSPEASLSPSPSPSVTASAAAPSPSGSAAVPTVSGWSRAKTRLAAAPWFFAIVGVVVVGGIVLVRRRRSA